MITPRFTLDQDDKFLLVTIYAPFTSLENTEIFMDGTDFRFFSKPYYLRLHLPGEVEESDDACGEYLADTTSFFVKCPKKNIGEHFNGLDMISKLLTPSGETSVRNTVEEIDGDLEDAHADEDEDIDWYISQSVPEEKETMKITDSTANYGYGFNFQRTGVFKNLLEDFEQLLDVKVPDSKTLSERSEERKNAELTSFNPDHYLCDLYETEEINQILSYETCWQKLLRTEKIIDKRHELLALSKTEQEQILALPRRQYKLTEQEKLPVFFSLLDLVYGMCYDVRINGGESGTESGWCIAKLSPTLCACTRHTSLKETVISSVRRALIYPLYRHWDLSILVWKDVLSVLKVGKVAVLKMILNILACFGETEGYYIFSQLYIQDYAVWVQSVPDSHIQSLVFALEKTIKGLTKSAVDLELDELEAAAELTIQEETSHDGLTEDANQGEPVDSLAHALNNQLSLDSDDSSDDSDDDTSDSSDAESESETETES